MRLPELTNNAQPSKKYMVQFAGINYGDNQQEGELSESKNLSSSRFPIMSQRSGRTKVLEHTSPTAIFDFKGKLCVVDGTSFLYDDVAKGTVTAGKKQFAVIGQGIIIFPDKKYYDTSTDTFGELERTYSAGAGTLTFTDNTITSTGATFSFRAGDAVTITGCSTHPENNKTPIIRSVAGKVLTFNSNTFTAGVEAGAVTIMRKVPDLEGICESNNRIWGYAGNTIYGSALGDPFNFFVYDGLTTDSYSVAVGTDGNFTGVAAYSSHIAFFKEDYIHKLFGTKPANYQIQTSQVAGVQDGCAGSIVMLNEMLLYKGRNGVYAYTGGIPELISSAFGRRRYSEALAETDGERYYISMKSGDEWGLWVYDVLRNIWLKEDNTHVDAFCNLAGSVYFINNSDDSVYKIDEGSAEVFEWSATFCPFNEVMTERKGYSKLSMRLDLDAGAWCQVEVNADYKGWELAYITHDETARTIYIPIIPTRCDNFQVKVSGEGRCALKALVRDFQYGSEV